MNRRKFLKESSIAAISISAFTFGSCQPGSFEKNKVNSAGSLLDNFELNEITIDGLQEKMKSGAYSSRAITEMYLKRIQEIDKSGPRLNSVIETNPDALKIADEMDKERKNGKTRGPLHGIPVLIKDNINTADKMTTTAGSLALEGHITEKDAFIVKKLREAGAVIIGKTNLSEWANFRSTRSSSGWSSRGGQTKNPYILDRSPCGSSSGSGTAVSANLCAVAIGTETNGSIACPASTDGVVGIKPTVGLWSRSGIIPISHTQDTAGPLTRTVRDGAILLGALAGTSDDDPITNRNPGNIKQDYTSSLNVYGLRNKKIGVEKSLLKGHEAIDALLQNAISQMKALGATVVEVELLKQLHGLDGEEFKVLKYEFKDGLNRYLATTNAKMKSLKDIIEFNIQNEARAMPYFKQEIMDSCQVLGDLKSKEYTSSLHKLLTVTRGAIDKLLKEQQLDSICGPAAGPPWCIDLINGDFFTGYSMYSPAAVAGYPSITVPMGRVKGLPVGLSFIGSPYSEPALLSIAYAYEQASKNRVMPGFIKTFEAP